MRLRWGLFLDLSMVALAGIVSLSLTACGGDGSSPSVSTSPSGSTTTSAGPGPSQTSTAQKTFTLEELAQFDGQDGRPAYVAVDGVVYDVTGSRSWPDGAHTRCNLNAVAGADLSELLERAPANMRGLVEMLPIVGELTP